jgi:ATP-dependent helicase/nuclease subunit A
VSGNLIVVAGAGTGKTHTLVQECLARLDQGVELTELLVVTFTKAAAAELRERIARELQKRFAEQPDSAKLARQIAMLDRAQISTLHSFCLELVSRHFSELGLSPRLVTLEASQAAVLRNEALDALFETYYDAKTDATREARQILIDWFNGDDRLARSIISDLHQFTQTRPDPAKWFADQRALLANDDPAHWREWHTRAIEEWVKRWRPAVERQPNGSFNPARAVALGLMDKFDVAAMANVYNDETLWPSGSKGPYRKPLEKMFDEAAALTGWMRSGASDPLLEDWKLVREVTLRLLVMAEEFSEKYSELKLARGFIDFHDLEQFSLRLLWNGDTPSPIAQQWRARLKWIFVDEYQDINSAQDRIIQALARENAAGNRFLVGDVKQSIYGFRQAEPSIFCAYEKLWSGTADGSRRYLVNNWRSHERILDFINGLFTGLMQGEIGEVVYDENARLAFAEHKDRVALSKTNDPAAKVEVHLIEKHGESSETDNSEDTNGNTQDLVEFDRVEAEAELIAQLCDRIVTKDPVTLPNGEPAKYEDIVILLRSAANEAEPFAKVFSRRGIPLDARRIGFFSSIEVLDLQGLLTILDNPLQDIPLLGVLRSPIGCFTASDLADVRAAKPRGPIWLALKHLAECPGSLPIHDKARDFLAKLNDGARCRDTLRWRSASKLLSRKPATKIGPQHRIVARNVAQTCVAWSSWRGNLIRRAAKVFIHFYNLSKTNPNPAAIFLRRPPNRAERCD